MGFICVSPSTRKSLYELFDGVPPRGGLLASSWAAQLYEDSVDEVA